MTHLAAIIALALSAPAVAPKAARPKAAAVHPAARKAAAQLPPLDELPKAPVEIVLPPKGDAAARKAESPTARNATPGQPAGQGALPTDAEILAAASGKIADPRPGYALVEQKCGRCHPMERALDASIAPGDWDAYLKRKLRRHGTGISAEQAAEIARFLSSWAEQRAGK